jgi:2-keto-4-pentenoate hydratase
MSMTAERSGSLEHVAQALDEAWRTRRPIAPITETHPGLTVADAYEIQSRWTAERLSRGEEIVGRKIGLTSPAVQQQLGVSEPDYGALWRSSLYSVSGGRTEVPAADFLQPRIEGELAFLIRDPLPAGGVTAADILAAAEACALAVEIVDSRIADWRIKLVDTVADNASYGGFAVGPWDRALLTQDLAALAMQVRQNGEPAGEGLGSAVLGNPAHATAWLANKLNEFGVTLKPGDVVISGAFCRMLPAKAGDEFVFSLTGQPDLTVAFV